VLITLYRVINEETPTETGAPRRRPSPRAGGRRADDALQGGRPLPHRALLGHAVHSQVRAPFNLCIFFCYYYINIYINIYIFFLLPPAPLASLDVCDRWLRLTWAGLCAGQRLCWSGASACSCGAPASARLLPAQVWRADARRLNRWTHESKATRGSDSKISYRKVSAPRKWASAALLLESELFGARFFRLNGDSSDRTVILRFHGLLDRKLATGGRHGCAVSPRGHRAGR